MYYSCDADPAALAKYVVALVKKDKPVEELKEICIDQLEVFLSDGEFGASQSNVIIYYYFIYLFPFQKISKPSPRKDLEFPWGMCVCVCVCVGGGGVRDPGNSRGEGGWTIKITFQGDNFELSTKIATY